MLFSPAVGPLFCHPSRCSGPQVSSRARRQSSVLDQACGLLSPASSSLVVFASRVRFTCCAWSGGLPAPLSSRDLATRRCSLELFSCGHHGTPCAAHHGTPWLSGVASREPLFSISCLPVHVLTHVFSSARFSRARLLWHIVVLGGLLDTPLRLATCLMVSGHFSTQTCLC